MRATALVFSLLGLGCFVDQPSGAGASDTDGGCEGAVGCACYGNMTCDEGLECHPEVGLCVSGDCATPELGCPCDEGGCNDGLMCDGAACVDPPTETGGEGGGEALILYGSAENYLPGSPPPATDMRVVLDAMCNVPVPECSTSVAVISIDETDQIADLEMREMPFDLAVWGFEGYLADSFDRVLSAGMLDTTLLDVGVFDDSATFYWSGSLADGTIAPDTCDGWTSTFGEGMSGKRDRADSEWLEGGTRSCGNERPILCACW